MTLAISILSAPAMGNNSDIFWIEASFLSIGKTSCLKERKECAFAQVGGCSYVKTKRKFNNYFRF
jgi:hypothetical protein